ncbi:hypothetical protein JCM6882_001580 [Rhodosporidiobolus microsporus]
MPRRRRPAALPSHSDSEMPSVESDPRAWNAWWEEFHANPESKATMDSTLDSVGVGLSCDNLWAFNRSQQSLASEVRHFADYLASSPSHLDLLPYWEGLGPEDREGLALRAFQSAESYSSRKLDRLYIPDITVKYLAGHGYRNLMASVLYYGLPSLQDATLYEVHSSTFDAMFGIDRAGLQSRVLKFRARQLINMRHAYILSLLRYISGQLLPNLDAWQKNQPRNPSFRPFHPRPSRAPVEKLILPDTEHQISPSSPHQGASQPVRDLFEGSVPKRYRKAVRRLAQEERDRAQNPPLMETCQACWRELAQMPEMVGVEKPKFSYCAPCLTINRRMGYCSRDCQVRHYKQHKQQCGKYLADILPTPTFTTDFPPPPPFNALIQLSLLALDSASVYHFPITVARFPSLAILPHYRFTFPAVLGRDPGKVEEDGARWREDYPRLFDEGWEKDTEQRLAPLLFRLVREAVVLEGFTAADIVMQVAGDWEVHPKTLADALDVYIAETKPVME